MHESSPGTGDGPQTLSCSYGSYSQASQKGLDLDLGSAVPAPGAEFVVEWDMLVTGYGTSSSHTASLMGIDADNSILRAVAWGQTSCNDQQTHSYRLEATSSGKKVKKKKKC